MTISQEGKMKGEVLLWGVMHGNDLVLPPFFTQDKAEEACGPGYWVAPLVVSVPQASPEQVEAAKTRTCVRCGETKPMVKFVKATYCPNPNAAYRRSYCYICGEAKKTRKPSTEYWRRYEKRRMEDPEKRLKIAAAKAVRHEIRKGRMTRQPCEVCGSTTVHGHHDDYSKPLAVRWLCPEHHREHHLAEKAKREAAA